MLSNSLQAQATELVDSHEILVRLTPGSGAVEIDDVVIVSGRDQYNFELAPWLAIESMTLDGAKPELQRRGEAYVIELGTADRHQLRFALKGIVPARGEDQAGSSATYSSSGSDGAFLPAYAAWIPQDLSTPIAYRLTVRVPIAQRAVASGTLIDETLSEEFYQAKFEANPAGEPPSLFAGPYQVRERQRNGLRLRTYFHAEIADLSDIYLEAALSYIQRYQAAIGPMK